MGDQPDRRKQVSQRHGRSFTWFFPSWTPAARAAQRNRAASQRCPHRNLRAGFVVALGESSWGLVRWRRGWLLAWDISLGFAGRCSRHFNAFAVQEGIADPRSLKLQPQRSPSPEADLCGSSREMPIGVANGGAVRQGRHERMLSSCPIGWLRRVGRAPRAWDWPAVTHKACRG